MRRSLLVLAVVLTSPAGAKPAVPMLTVKAPAATYFGHRIEFVGRVRPAAAGALIHLYRGKTVVASARARADGTFRIPVRLGRPGPFRVGWLGAFSNEVTVRIHPYLEAALVGPRVVGAPLTLVARLRPEQAGTLRIRIVQGKRSALVHLYRGGARVRLGTTSFARLRVQVETVPRRGYAAAPSRTLAVTLAPAALAVGGTSSAVAEATRRLAALHYATPPAATTFGSSLLDTVYAFEKVQGLPRTGVVDARFWARLDRPAVPRPRYSSLADHIEIDKSRQVLFIVRGGRIVLISPVSTAGIPGYFTPVGRFAIYRKVDGFDPSPLGVLYKPMYFTGGYAIHGNPSVPPYPASHGCVRVPMWLIPRLFVSEPYGETVYVY